jgi:hypothetical protein
MSNTILLPFQPDAMSPAQLAAVSYLARYSGHTHHLYAYQLRRWFAWCEMNRLEALVGIQRAHVELYIRHRGEKGLRASSINTMMHGVRGFFRFAGWSPIARPHGLKVGRADAIRLVCCSRRSGSGLRLPHPG